MCCKCVKQVQTHSVCVTDDKFTGGAVCESIGVGVHSTLLSEAWGGLTAMT